MERDAGRIRIERVGDRTGRSWLHPFRPTADAGAWRNGPRRPRCRRGRRMVAALDACRAGAADALSHADRKRVVWGKSVSVSVELGVRPVITKKNIYQLHIRQ